MSSDTAPGERTGSSARALRALAHPVRLDLLDLLRLAGPSTASQCAERLSLTPKVCSYHLRTLAKYGFVEETGDGKGRARPWRLVRTRVEYVHRHQASPRSGETHEVDNPDNPDNPAQPGETAGADEAGNEFARVMLDRDANTITRFIAERHRLDGEWRNVSTMSSNSVLLTPDQLADLTADLGRLRERYDARAVPAPANARPVRVALYAIPDLTSVPPTEPPADT